MMTQESNKQLREDKKVSWRDYGIIDMDDLVPAEGVDWYGLTQSQAPERGESYQMDVDRMVNEGLGGGLVTEDNGYIGDSTTDTMMVETPPSTTEDQQ